MRFCVYKFLNKDSDIIYIGQSTNLDQRINKQHFTVSGHLPQQCYDETTKIYYTELNSKLDMDLMEMYLIGKYRPKYNTTFNNCDVTISIEEPQWTEYIRPEKVKPEPKIVIPKKINIVKEILFKYRKAKAETITNDIKEEVYIEKDDINIDTIENNIVIEEVENITEEIVEQNVEETIPEETQKNDEKINYVPEIERIYSNLGKVLQDNNISQAELARRLNCTRATVSNVVRGIYTPSFCLALRIGYVLNMPVEQIFYIKDN